MEFKHTPGEWIATELRRGTYDKPKEQWEVVPIVRSSCGLESGNGSDATICEVPAGDSAFRIGKVNGRHTVTLEEARANALVMAAAPRLARALALVTANPRIRSFLFENDPAAFQQAHEALLAATGLIK